MERILLFVLLFIPGILALPEQGAFEVNMTEKQNIAVFAKSMYNGTKIAVKIHCNQEESVEIKVRWLLRWTPCAQEYADIESNQGLAQAYFSDPTMLRDMPYSMVKYQMYEEPWQLCQYGKYITLNDTSGAGYNMRNGTRPPTQIAVTEQKKSVEDASGAEDKDVAKSRNKRQAENAPEGQARATAAPPAKSTPASTPASTTMMPGTTGSTPSKPSTTKTSTPKTSTAKMSTPETSTPKTSMSKASTSTPKTATSKTSTSSPKTSLSKASTLKTSPPKTSTPKTSTTTEQSVSVERTDEYEYFDTEESSADFHQIALTWEDGIYLFLLNIESKQGPDPNVETQFDATVDVRMKGPRGGYISAIEWPLLPFYAVMCVVYVIFGLIWLVLSACNWRDLLRIQFWIGGVIFLGMLEKAVFFAEHESINTTGRSVKGAMLFGELVSCLKRTLARMLVVVVSLGFGIVKPRLGPMLHKVLAMGGLYFVLCGLEGSLRVLSPKSDQSNTATLAAIPLAVLDAAICWWIFTGLVTTIRTLRLRRNLVKLSLYRHFTNTLIFAVVASVAFMVWSITQHKFSKCLSDWKELWVDEAFWHLLFSVILMVIMLLWRPSANNQRYAFSPLMDAADDEAGEPMITDAFDGMKMRGKGSNNSPASPKSRADDDLKWIDENIPTSVADTALPSLLDSDEEMMNTKYEMSKME